MMTGQTVSHFEILEKLGEGGMGVVYKARDTQLDRLVALKFLPPDSARESDRLMRFVQEARAASALNHPNIITIHEIGSFQGAEFIAMEFVRGKNLDQLIRKKGLCLSEILKYAIQIADALAKAHAAGIMHRDLKPANIMVSEDGVVKVLDFGLAKLAEPVEAPGQFGVTVSLKAREAPHTEDGAIVGTVAYMAPEQAEGKKVDARSDIFSFGSVLYEMLTGRPPFRGDSKLSTLSAILRDDPKPMTQAGDVPRDLEKIILHCLRKDPDRRFQHMDDLKLALLDVKEESESGKLEALPLRAAQPRRWWIGVAAMLVALGLAALFLWLRPGVKPTRTTLTRLTFDSGLATDPTISADGKLVAYASDRAGQNNLDIYVQQSLGGTPVRLTSDAADDHHPSFSPDGSRIAFRSEREGGGIYTVSVLGGEERLLAKDGDSPRFSPDSNWVAYHVGSTLRPCAIYIVAANGGTPRKLETDVPWTYAPVWSPDGRHLMFLGAQDALVQLEYDWFVAPAGGGPAIATGATRVLQELRLTGAFFGALPADWLPGGDLLFSAGLGDSISLWTLPVARRTFHTSGPARQLTQGSGTEVNPRFALTPAGASRYVFSSLDANIDLWSLPVDVNQGKTTGELRRLTEGTAQHMYPTLSADDRKLVFTSNRSGNMDVWVRDMATGKDSAVTTGPERKTRAMINPDGTRVAYVVSENNKPVIRVMALHGTGESQTLCDNCGLPIGWTPDGKSLLNPRDKPIQWFLLNAQSGKMSDLLRHPKYDIHRLQISPDSRWLAFNPKIGPRKEPIFVAPYRPGNPAPETEWIEITDGGGSDGRPLWAASGNLLYFVSYRDGFQCIYAQRLDPSSKRPVGAPLAVLHFHSARRPLLDSYGLFVGRAQIVMSLRESRGDIWMAEMGR